MPQARGLAITGELSGSRNSSRLFAFELLRSGRAHSVLNSVNVISDVQQVALAGWNFAGWLERTRALCCKRRLQNIGRSGEVALGVPANQFEVLGKCDVAFDDASTLFCGSDVAFATVFRIA